MPMRPGFKKFLKITLISIASLLGLCVVAIAVAMWVVFTPSRLTPMVEDAADRYLDADVRIGRVDLKFFSSFPRLTLRIDDGELTVRGAADSVRAEGPLMPHRDSLLRFARCRVTFDPVALLKDRRVIIHRVLLDSARVYAYRDAGGRANWNFIPPSRDTVEADAADSAGGFRPEAIVLRSLRVRDADIVFNDRSNDIYARVAGVNTRLRMGAGERGAAAGVEFSCRNLLLRQKGNLLMRRTAVRLNTRVGYNADSMKVVLRNAELGVNDINLSLSGTAVRDTVRRAVDLDLSFGAAAPSVEKALRLIPESVVRHKDLTADGSVLLEGTVKGAYGKELMPAVSLCLKIEDASARYEGLPYGIDHLSADFDAFVDLMRERESYLDLKIFKLQGNDIDVLADAKVTELFEDPLIVLNTKAKVNLGNISKTFPLQAGIEYSGLLDADLKVRTRLSTIRNQDFGRIFAAGNLDLDGVTVRDAAHGIDAVGDIDLKFFGARALGVSGEVSRLHLESPRISALADSLKLRVISTRPRDTTRVFQMKADFGMNRVGASVGDSLKVYCGKGGITASLRPREDRPDKQRIEVLVETDSVFLKNGEMTGGMNKGTISLGADKLRDSLWRPSATVSFNRLRGGLGDSLRMFCMKGELDAFMSLYKDRRGDYRPRLNVRLETDSIFARMGETGGGMKKGVVRIQADKVRDSLWIPSGTVRFSRLTAKVPQCALPVHFNSTVVKLGDRQISLDRAAVRVGTSSVFLTGTVHNLYGAMRHGRMLRARLDIKSRNLNLNQLMRAFASPEADEQDLEADTVSTTQMRLFEVPDRINFQLTADIDRLRFGEYIFRDIKGNAELRDSHIYLENLSLTALDDAVLNASLIYKAASSRFGYAGFDIKVKDIDIASLVEATPAIDSLVPMLESFKGKVQVDVAAEGVLDSLLNIRIPSLRSAVYIRGDSLVLMDGKTFAEISRKLMFKNKKENLIDSISVNITVEDGSVNIYPFLVEIDRYQAAVGGVQNLDMSFDYHISLLKSPLPFRAGLNIRGTPDDMRFGIGRARYKDAVTPVETRKVDSARMNLSNEITRRFRNAGERNRWGDRAAARTRIDWERKRDSVRRHHRIVFEEDSIQWEKVAPLPPAPGGPVPEV